MPTPTVQRESDGAARRRAERRAARIAEMPLRQRIIELPFDPDAPPERALARGASAFSDDPYLKYRNLAGKLFQAKEVADLLGVSHRWVTDRAQSGAIPSYKLPGSNRYRFNIDEVMACLERNGS